MHRWLRPPPFTSRRLMTSSRLRISNATAQIELLGARENVGDAILSQTCEVRVGHRFGQHDDDRIASDVAAAPGDLAVRIEDDATSGRIAPGEPRFSRVPLIGVIGIGITLGVFLAGDAADQPGVNREPLVQPLENYSSARVFGPPSVRERTPIEAGDHVADHVRLHAALAR